MNKTPILRLIMLIALAPIFGCMPSGSFVTPTSLRVTDDIQSTALPTNTATSGKEEAFTQLYDYEDTNVSIHLETPIEFNTDLVLGLDVGIAINNDSNYSFVLNYETGIHLLTFFDYQWIQIKNNVEYAIAERTIKPGWSAPLTVIPLPDDLAKPLALRILIVGTLLDDQGNMVREAASYVDMIVPPEQ